MGMSAGYTLEIRKASVFEEACHVRWVSRKNMHYAPLFGGDPYPGSVPEFDAPFAWRGAPPDSKDRDQIISHFYASELDRINFDAVPSEVPTEIVYFFRLNEEGREFCGEYLCESYVLHPDVQPRILRGEAVPFGDGFLQRRPIRARDLISKDWLALFDVMRALGKHYGPENVRLIVFWV